MPEQLRSRGALFAALVGACVLVAGTSVVWAAARTAAPSGPAGSASTGPGEVLYRAVADDSVPYGEVAAAPVGDPTRPAKRTGLVCARVHFAAGRGLCLMSDGVGMSYQAKVFDGDFVVRTSLSRAGIPSRARVSRDGRYGTVTAFVAGHSYADAGSFSTETVLIDMEAGRVLANLEEFEVTRGGETLRAPDFNFWGVTFAEDSDRFYATLATGGRTYLVEGDVDDRRVRTLRENVECPSLSPDGTRVAYKKLDGARLGAARTWRLHVLDLETLEDTPLAETRSVDDQVEWLDDGRVLYGVDGDVWVAPADGGGTPRRFLRRAASPAVVR